MDNIELTHTEIFLKEIRAFTDRDNLSECWEILWRKWDSRLINEYFVDNHLNKVEGRINRITRELYFKAKTEIIDKFDEISSKINVSEKLYLHLTTEIKNVLKFLSTDSLTNHISELNNGIKCGEVILPTPRFIIGKYDTDDESEWTETQKPDLIDVNEIGYFTVMINPILLALENLLLTTEIVSKRSKKELEKLLLDVPVENNNFLLLPSLLKNPKLIESINAWFLDKGFIELYDHNDVCPYLWIGKKDNEEMEIYSKVNISDSDKYFDKKTLKFSLRYQAAAFGKWLFKNKLLDMETYNASLVGRGFIAYYHLENSTSNQKAFRDEKGYSVYLDYYRELKL